jgi:hypothetical protein
MCKPWKMNGLAKGRLDSERFADHRRRDQADREVMTFSP